MGPDLELVFEVGRGRADGQGVIITLAEYDALAEDECRRHELVGGVLVEMPPRFPSHQRALIELTHQLGEQLPAAFDVVHSFDVLLRDGDRPAMRKPDVVVAPAELFERDVTRFGAADVALVAEVVSVGSEEIDRRVKPIEYAMAGIPHYWIVELGDPISMVAYVLVDGRYERVAGGAGTVQVDHPSPIVVDLDRLTRRR